MEPITDTEAEKRTISAMLNSEPACIEILATINEDDFSVPLNRNIFLLAKNLFIRGIKPTYIELAKEGHKLGLFETPQQLAEIRDVAESYVEEGNSSYWMNQVYLASKGRKAQNLLLRCNEEIRQSNLDINSFIARAGSEFMALAMNTETEKIDTGKDIAELGIKLVSDNVEKWRKLQEDYRFTGQLPMEGVPTGLPKLDSLTLGYKPGDLIILGAETGKGKTAFAINTAMAVCVDTKKPLLYVNTEMTRQQIAYRWGAILSQIPMQKLRAGSLTNGELSQVKNTYSMLIESGFYTAYMPNLTPDKLQAVARKAKLQHGVELIILDYVGRMDKSDPRLAEWQVLYSIAKTQKQLAQNLDVACMMLVQLNEDGSLQGAKQMKNECDLMLKLLPMCEDLKNEEKLNEAQQIFCHKYNKRYEWFNYRLWVDKSRDSEAGLSIPLAFDLERQQIQQAKEVS